MNKVIRIFACLLALLMLFGCTLTSPSRPENKPISTDKPKTEEPAPSNEKPADEPAPENPPVNTEPKPAPEVQTAPKEVDVTVSYEYSMAPDERGIYISARGPLLTPGYEIWGDMQEAPELSPALQESIKQLSNNLSYMTAADAETLRYSAQMSADDHGWYSIERALYMTRCDEDYISYYVKAWMSDPRLELENVTYFAVNLDKNGRMDTFKTAFTDTDSLGEIIFNAFQYNYPFTEFYPDALEIIKNSVDTGDGSVSFALANGGVMVMVNGDTISSEKDGHITFLSYFDYPELVKPECMTQSDSWIIPMEYGVTYTPDENHVISMYWDLDEVEYTGFWTVCVNGIDMSEEFYGYSPTCWLIKKNGTYYVYLRVPVGDVSRLGKVYELGSDKITFVADTELAFADEMCYNTEHLKMLSNEFYYGDEFYLDTAGMYRIGDNGVPELISDEFKLSGSTVTPRKTERLYTADGGFTTVAGGIELTPLKTDKRTYIDFLSEDGRIIRISINEFGYGMLFFGDTDPDDFFERVEEGSGY